MKKEKKEEIKKSNIIKESIAGTAKLYSQEKLYDERIRMMKLNTKFRKVKGTSKKKVSIQEDNFLKDSRK